LKQIARRKKQKGATRIARINANSIRKNSRNSRLLFQNRRRRRVVYRVAQANEQSLCPA
jgi:hypothetical protein